MPSRAPPPVLPEKYSLPRPERQTPVSDRDRERRRRERGLDVGRHVIGTLLRMREMRVALRHQPAQPILEVPARRGVGVFLDRQAGRGMLNHHRAQSLSDPYAGDDVLDPICELEQPLTRRAYLDRRYHLPSRLLKNTRIGLFSWPSCVSRPPRQRCARGHAVPTRGPATPAAGDQGHLASRFRNRTKL